MEKLNSDIFFNNLIFTLIILVACFLQISLNFLSFFMISQPYILAIILFLTIRRLNYEASSVLIILCGLLYDLITGGLIGIHSLFLLLLKIFTMNFNFSKKLLKKYGEWFLFSFSYMLSLLIVKVIFLVVNLKFPDIYAISFNIGTTLLLFPVILFLIDIPKVVFKVFISK
tara:strand:+ start:1484 stop:1996 length:513 start_codon:yes stop_codon:yes gene_type:complete